jgi:hypothetical protein
VNVPIIDIHPHIIAVDTHRYPRAPLGGHVEAPFPPVRTRSQQLRNTVPQREIMRALLRGFDGWVRKWEFVTRRRSTSSRE